MINTSSLAGFENLEFSDNTNRPTCIGCTVPFHMDWFIQV